MPKVNPADRSRLPLLVVLSAGLWLPIGAYVLGYGDARRAVPVGIFAAAALVVLASVQLLDAPSRSLSRLVVWVGVGLAVAPVALRYGYIDRIDSAYVNHIAVGAVVVLAGVRVVRAADELDASPAGSHKAGTR